MHFCMLDKREEMFIDRLWKVFRTNM